MKKNLLFASSVFAITLIGLLVFCEVSKDTENEDEVLQQEQTIKNQTNEELVYLQQ